MHLWRRPRGTASSIIECSARLLAQAQRAGGGDAWVRDDLHTREVHLYVVVPHYDTRT